MRIKKGITIIIVVLCIVIIYSDYCYAGNRIVLDPYLSYGWPSGITTVQPYSNSLNPTWTSLINNGLSKWNNSSAVVSISVSSSSPNTIEAGNYSDTWYGLNTPSFNPSTGLLSSYNIKINATTIYSDASNFSNFATSVIVHEFGHTFWLCDNPYTTFPSIMNQNRNRNSMISPQTFDINNVNTIYSLL